MQTKAIQECVELDVELMKFIRGDTYTMPHKRLEAAEKFVDGLIKQLEPKDRKVFEEE